MTNRTENQQGVLDEQLAWHQKMRQGCIYAAHLAKKSLAPPPNSYYSDYWGRAVLSGHDQTTVLSMTAFVNDCHQHPERQLASVLLPDIKTRKTLIDFVGTVQSHYPGVIIQYEDSTRSSHTLVRIRVPLSDGVCAYALGFGPFDWLPPTRQAPFTELVLPTKSKQFLKNKYNRHSLNQAQPDSQPRAPEPTFVHLADINVENVTTDTELDTRYWHSTHDIKIAKLSGDNSDRAKAKVTFSLTGPASQFASAPETPATTS